MAISTITPNLLPVLSEYDGVIVGSGSRFGRVDINATALAAASDNAERAEDAANRAEVYAYRPNPLYFLHAGQSNAFGANGATSANWPGVSLAGLAFVWVPSLSAWRDVTTRRGLEPFNPDGSNNSGAWAAIELALRNGVVVRMITSYSSGTQISAWTGGGYTSGVPITTDRTISAGNRALCFNLQAQITAAAIPRIHAIGWQQGEADFTTPDAIYVQELDFLRLYFSGLGSNPLATARVPFVIGGLYSGISRTGQERRNACLAEYAIRATETVGYAPAADLVADLTGNSPGAFVHFDDLSLKTLGLRIAAAIDAVWDGQSSPLDPRVEALIIPGTGVAQSRLGYRSHELDTETGTRSPTIRGLDAAYRGETRRFLGTCTVNLDPTASATWRDGGAGFDFYVTSASDAITFKSDDGAGGTRPVWRSGTPAAVAGGTGIVVTGARGRGRVVFEFDRWIVYFWPHAGLGFRTLAGDNGYTLSAPEGRFVLLTATITASRVVDLASTGAIVGDVFSVRRTGGGAFNWTIRDQGTPSSSHVLSAAGQWVDMVFDGTIWVPWRS